MNAIMDFIRVAGNALLNSVRTATFCWVAVGLVVAIPVIRNTAKKKRGKKKDNDYSLEGMSLGMCLGLLIGTMLGNYMGVAVSLGMIVGLVIGMLIPKKINWENK